MKERERPNKKWVKGYSEKSTAEWERQRGKVREKESAREGERETAETLICLLVNKLYVPAPLVWKCIYKLKDPGALPLAPNVGQFQGFKPGGRLVPGWPRVPQTTPTTHPSAQCNTARSPSSLPCKVWCPRAFCALTLLVTQRCQRNSNWGYLGRTSKNWVKRSGSPCEGSKRANEQVPGCF